jgi:hypothetical protein
LAGISKYPSVFGRVFGLKNTLRFFLKKINLTFQSQKRTAGSGGGFFLIYNKTFGK